MKYKLIPSFIHDFTHSFMSLMNYFQNDYTVDTLREFVSALPERKLEVMWYPSFVCTSPNIPDRVSASLSHYSEWLPKLAQSMKVDLSHISEIKTIFDFSSRFGFQANTRAKDDRGKIYTIEVQ